MLAGVAIGDSLGNTSESTLPEHRRAMHGRITDFLPNRYADRRRVGVPTDDTQLTAWTIEHVLAEGTFRPEGLSDLFRDRRIFGIGTATRDFQEARRRGATWQEAGQPSAGNGVLMRIAGHVAVRGMLDTKTLHREIAANAVVTHRDPFAISAAVAFGQLLRRLLSGDVPSSPSWWLDSYIDVARQYEVGDGYRTRVPAGPFADWHGQPSDFIDGPVRDALNRGMSVLEAQSEWYSGAYLLETLPTVLLTLAKHYGEPEQAILVAVNDTRDSDTIAAIVGAAIGALHGDDELPQRWRDGMLWRTGVSDDGAYLHLIDGATRLWSL
jgi:ADP-ribosylglycohydrolase